MEPSAPHAADTGSSLGQRYHVVRELARGGMGVVYACEELVGGRQVAVKRLLPAPDEVRHRVHRQMFEHEYRTLAALRHPSIIEVHEYGVDAEGAYYAMELLGGQDIRELAPMKPAQLIPHLRDIASSLALLHARRLIHRDVTSRNVRLSSDGRAKLLDFGALTGFGLASNVTGTPSAIAPEALARGALDQRIDIYALGALAYFMLTGVNAYPARRLGDLPQLWNGQPPRRPIEGVAGVPPALDELVMAMISLEPLARPQRMAEVIDRLDALADRPREEDPVVAEGYLEGQALVGCDDLMADLRSALAEAMEGRGCVRLIEGPTGSGKTRLLDEFMIEAQLKGLTTMRTDAVGRGAPYGLIEDLLLDLERYQYAPLGDAFGELLIDFGHVAPRLRERLGGQAPRPCADPSELRARILVGLSRFFGKVHTEGSAVLAVDNLEAADAASLGALAALVEVISGSSLLLVASIGSERPPGGMALQRIEGHARTLPLPELTPEDTLSLVRSMLGNAPRVERLAKALHERGRSPRGTVEILRTLVEQGLVRYAHGSWHLPESEQLAQLPKDASSAVAMRLDRVSAPARRLAQAIALHDSPLSTDVVMTLSGQLADGASTQDPLAELQREDLIRAAAGSLVLDADVVARLRAHLDPAQTAPLHRLLADALAARDTLEDRLASGYHLVQAGDTQRGLGRLTDAAVELGERGVGLDRAQKALIAAAELHEAEGTPPLATLRVTVPLMLSGFYGDPTVSDRFGRRALATLLDVTGLDRAQRLQPLLGRRLALSVGVGWAAARYAVMPRSRRDDTPFAEFFTLLLASTTSMVAVAASRFDLARVEELVRSIAILEGLGEHHPGTLIYRFNLALRMLFDGDIRECQQLWRWILDELESTRMKKLLPATGILQLKAGALYGLASTAWTEPGNAALEAADKLEALGLESFHQQVLQIRQLHHLYRGEMEAAGKYQRGVERLAVQGEPTWRTDVSIAGNVMPYHLCADVMGLRHALGRLEHIVDMHPALGLRLQVTRACYEGHRGRRTEAIAAYAALQDRLPTALPSTAILAYGHWMRLLNEEGRHGEAVEVGARALGQLQRQRFGSGLATGQLDAELAIAQAALGGGDEAGRRVDALLDIAAAGDNPLIIGLLHRAAALVAFHRADAMKVAEHLRQMRGQFEQTRTPSLIHQCDRLERRVLPSYVLMGDRLAPERLATFADLSSAVQTCSDRGERASVLLRRLLRRAGCVAGYLYGFEDGRPVLLAGDGGPPPPELHQRLEHMLAEQTTGDQQATVSVSSEATVESGPRGHPDGAHCVLPLTLPGGERGHAVGVLALANPAWPGTLKAFELQVTAELLLGSGATLASGHSRSES